MIMLDIDMPERAQYARSLSRRPERALRDGVDGFVGCYEPSPTAVLKIGERL